MINIMLSAGLGAFQGCVIIPLTFYIGLLVWRDFSHRFAKFYSIANIVVPLAFMLLWLSMSYLAADSLLDLVAKTAAERLKIGRVWIRCSFLGLVALAVIFIVANRLKKFKGKGSVSNLD